MGGGASFSLGGKEGMSASYWKGMQTMCHLANGRVQWLCLGLQGEFIFNSVENREKQSKAKAE